MATLETQDFNYKPDIEIIKVQCDQVIKGNPSRADTIKKAVKNLKTAGACLERGDIPKALEKLQTIGKTFDLGLDELEASCLYYMGVIILSASNMASTDEKYELRQSGIDNFNIALSKTKDPWLALSAYNLMMIVYLSNEECDNAILYADATERVTTKLSKSKASTYYSSAASYNKAEAYYRQRKFSEAVEHIGQAMDGFKELSMNAEATKCKGLLGNALIATGETERGLKEVQKSIEIFRKLNIEQEVAFLLAGRGVAMQANGDINQAKNDLRDAIKIYRSFGDTAGVNKTLAILTTIDG